MPNQPKTPARTFRLDDEVMQKLRETQERTGAKTVSETMREAVKQMHRFTEAVTDGLHGLPLEAVVAADEAAWLDVHMPRPEADRRLTRALNAARPFLEADARRDERQRTLRDVITRLESLRVDQSAIDHLKSLLD